MDSFSQIFTNDFMPHGHCYFWRPDILWTHVLSDAGIAIAYFCIPAILLFFLFKKKPGRIPFWWVLILFASFIYLCGVTHIIGIVTVWKPVYILEGWLKAATALISVITAATLIPLVPKALTLRSAEELATVNSALENEIVQRDRVQRKLHSTVTELQYTNQELEEISSITAHDLQASLRRMITYTNALEDQLRRENHINDESEKLLKAIDKNGRRMRAHLGEVLNFSTLSTEQEFEVIDVKETASQIMDELIDDSLTVDFDVDIQLSQPVKAPKKLIYHVLHNLLENAIKYRSPERDLVIRFTAGEARNSHDDAVWSFCVTDNGIGIDNEQFDKVFKLFGRLHDDKTYSGHGVGLAAVKKMLTKNGGEIWLESKAGEGSSFHFTLPVPR